MLKKLIPRKLITLVRFYSIFNGGHGHSRIENGFCTDGKGRPVPWLTYPCIEFLDALDFQDCRVFEYGAGASTHYWAAKAKEVRSVEREKDWTERLQGSLPPNAKVTFCPDERQYPGEIIAAGGQFDVVVVDGAVRYPCVEATLDRLTARGIVILDNLEWYPNCAKLLRDRGFIQIDFSGFPPINAFTSCTSIFYRSPELLTRRLNAPEWRPVGGRYLVAHDDVPLAAINPATLRTGSLEPELGK